MAATDPLKRNLDWYIAHQEELAAKYDGKVLLIVDESLLDVFDTLADAYAAAVKHHEPGTFTLQPCSPGIESYTHTLYTPRLCAAV